MTEELVNLELGEVKINSKTLCIGCDVGTMNLCAARSDNTDIKIMRNVFLEINKDEETKKQEYTHPEKK